MKKRTGEDRIITTPNILSFLRIVMIPFIILSFLRQEYIFGALFVILSGMTDLLDGYTARRYQDITKIGKMLDPVADKLTQVAIIIGIVLYFPLAVITLVIFVLKEFTMAMYNLYFMSKGHEYGGAIIYGKVSTAVFYFSMIIIFLIKGMNTTLSVFLLILTTSFLLISWISHMLEYTDQYKEYKREGLL